MKRNFYITTKLEVKRKGNSLEIGGKKFPISMVNALFLFPNAKITDGARNLLLQNGRPIIFMSGTYRAYGILVPELYPSSVRLRLLQCHYRENLEVARLIVLKKIEAIENVTGLKQEVYREGLKMATDFESVLGIEGAVSAAMFSFYGKQLQKIGIDIPFKRKYNPPTDEVNSLLSFLYTLYYHHFLPVVVSEGLDPYVAFLHRKRGRHATLVSDLMEDARPFLTFMTIPLLKKIYPKGFERGFLGREARKLVLQNFDQFVEEFQPTILKEVKKWLLSRKDWGEEKYKKAEYDGFHHPAKIFR